MLSRPSSPPSVAVKWAPFSFAAPLMRKLSVSEIGPSTLAAKFRVPRVSTPPEIRARSSFEGSRVMKLIAPENVLRPNSALCGPLITSTRWMSSKVSDWAPPKRYIPSTKMPPSCSRGSLRGMVMPRKRSAGVTREELKVTCGV